MMIKAIAFITISIYAWVFIIPLVYVYAKPTFFIVQYLPDLNMGLIIIWLLRYAMKSGKKEKQNTNAIPICFKCGKSDKVFEWHWNCFGCTRCDIPLNGDGSLDKTTYDIEQKKKDERK